MSETSKTIWSTAGVASTMLGFLGFALHIKLIEGFCAGVLLCVIGRFIEGRT